MIRFAWKWIGLPGMFILMGLPLQAQVDGTMLRGDLARLIARVRDVERDHALLQERYEAQQALLSGRAMREQLPVAGDPLLAWSYNDAGLLLAARGLYAEAEILYREALAILEGTYDRTLPARGTVLQNLAEVLWRQGDAEAFGVYQAAEQVFILLEGGAHPRLGALWNSWAGAAAAVGQANEAEALYRRAIDLYKGLPASLDAVVPLHNLALLLLAQGRAEKAGDLLGEALQILEDGGQEDSDWSLAVLRALVRQGRMTGDLASVERYEQRAGALAVQQLERTTDGK